MRCKLTDEKDLNEKLVKLQEVHAKAMNAFKAVGRDCCKWRAVGQCLAGCPGIMVCDIWGLEIIPDKR